MAKPGSGQKKRSPLWETQKTVLLEPHELNKLDESETMLADFVQTQREKERNGTKAGDCVVKRGIVTQASRDEFEEQANKRQGIQCPLHLATQTIYQCRPQVIILETSRHTRSKVPFSTGKVGVRPAVAVRKITRRHIQKKNLIFLTKLDINLLISSRSKSKFTNKKRM